MSSRVALKSMNMEIKKEMIEEEEPMEVTQQEELAPEDPPVKKVKKEEDPKVTKYKNKNAEKKIVIEELNEKIQILEDELAARNQEVDELKEKETQRMQEMAQQAQRMEEMEARLEDVQRRLGQRRIKKVSEKKPPAAPKKNPTEGMSASQLEAFQTQKPLIKCYKILKADIKNKPAVLYTNRTRKEITYFTKRKYTLKEK